VLGASLVRGAKMLKIRSRLSGGHETAAGIRHEARSHGAPDRTGHSARRTLAPSTD
jgi:hypothetical protein